MSVLTKKKVELSQLDLLHSYLLKMQLDYTSLSDSVTTLRNEVSWDTEPKVSVKWLSEFGIKLDKLYTMSIEVKSLLKEIIKERKV
jgi:hypothetical protein